MATENHATCCADNATEQPCHAHGGLVGRLGHGLSAVQKVVVVLAVCATIVATPALVWAATASFSSSTAAAAVTGKNTSTVSGAKGVYGLASGTQGSIYGVYGRANSASGYGIYSKGRLGTSGQLVCAQCVTADDINPTNFPTVPNANQLAGHADSYYGIVRSISYTDQEPRGQVSPVATLATLNGLSVKAWCGGSDGDVGAGAGEGVLEFWGQNGWLTLVRPASASYNHPLPESIHLDSSTTHNTAYAQWATSGATSSDILATGTWKSDANVNSVSFMLHIHAALADGTGTGTCEADGTLSTQP